MFRNIRDFAYCHLYVQELKSDPRSVLPKPRASRWPISTLTLAQPCSVEPAGLLTLDSWLGIASGEARG